MHVLCWVKELHQENADQMKVPMSVHEYTFNVHCNDIIEYYYNVNPLLCVCAFGIGAKKLEHSVGERDRRDGKSEE